MSTRDEGAAAPLHRSVAVALRYDAEREGAPRVVAKGRGAAAERLAATARDAGVPIREDAGLATTLAALDLDQVVPPDLYEALATVLAWAWEQEIGGSSTAATRRDGPKRPSIR